MPEPVAAWWARRQFSRGREIPYEVGTYRETWAAYPELFRQFLPHLNSGIQLSQVPPAADVLLLWQCRVGHRFAATPTEQRMRPGRVRRKSAWCPECTEAARPRPIRYHDAPPRTRPRVVICGKTPDLAPGTAFVSVCAPKPASAVEQELRAALVARLRFTQGVNAIRANRPFFEHTELWPDILIPELRVAVEYDSIGRHGVEHVGKREAADRRKDRAVRAVKWEVIRIRTGKLEMLGPHDLQMGALGPRGVDQIVDKLRAIRGEHSVDSLEHQSWEPAERARAARQDLVRARSRSAEPVSRGRQP